ncbi:MAG: peptidase S10 [Luteolibacter sp.]
MRLLFMCLILSQFVLTTAHAAPEASSETPPKAPETSDAEKIASPVILVASVTIDGKKISYRTKAGKLQLKQADGKPTASIFYVSYARTDLPNDDKRPVMFAFNGGPGSSSVWLHLGVLGPRRIQLPGDGTQPLQPPVQLVENASSILDECDLVFIDPVSTGYSRAEKAAKPEDFHQMDGDVESVGDFIRQWTSENQRWSSPKFLLGESYGGFRAALLADHLQERYGMSLNGVILMSSLLDFATIQPAYGNDLSYETFLPSFTSVAHFHGKIHGDRDALVREAQAFAFGDYAAALLKGNTLSNEDREKTAAKLAALTGIPASKWSENQLRISPMLFRGLLLKDMKKVLGRFDARVAWDTDDYANDYPNYDPSYSLALGAFSTAMMDYLGRDLGWKEDQPYEILTSKVQPWKWDSDNKVVNISDHLAAAMRDNPKLQVLVMSGRTDLATPPEGVAHSLRHLLGLSPALQKNFHFTYYEGGHMFYLNPPDLEKSRADLLAFLRASR